MANIINGDNGVLSGTAGLKSSSDGTGILALQTNGTTAVTVDENQRAAFVAGTAALPAITTTGDTNTGIFFPAADTIAFAEGGVEVMRINSSGNVGIGGDPTSGHKLNIIGTAATTLAAWGVTGTTTAGSFAQFVNTGNTTIIGVESSAGASLIGGTSAYASIFGTSSAASVQFVTNNSTRVTINSSGNMLVGTTSSVLGTPKFQAVNATDTSALFQCGTNSANNIRSWINTASGSRFHIAFGDGTTYTERGTISTNGTNTAYNTSSDYRLKENVQPLTGALSLVARLKPSTFRWKETGEEDSGFIAHELQEVCPSAVNGEKDAVNDDGSIRPQQIDTSFLVATLTAAIQEQQALITQLQADVAALKGTP